MERGAVMVIHSVIIGFLLYFFMIFLLGQSPAMAEDRSVLIAAMVLIYMVLFGHKMPGAINRHIL